MDNIYFLMIIALAILAIADLVVGVSNDAVNFLNSALGSKAISFRTIMIVASLGIACGAVFSSGLMEVARKGIFVPGEFMFSEIMIIFTAVMITDILLLDFFNTLGMPTSTTVSIVFELLGAAVAMALIKIGIAGGSFVEVVQYINTTKATEIILGILLSVVVAFSVGATVQYVSRLLLSFNFEKKSKWAGSVFGGFALTAITYFIFIKGLKGTEYYSEIAPIIEGKTVLILALSFIIWTLLSYCVVALFKKNIYKLIITVGTFALALAFAGNDLVNFIGVPIAAYQSYEAWTAAGVPATEFAMGVLGSKVPTPTIFLLVAGLVMVLTLWFSKKARYVTQTEINLSREGEAKERFEPNMLSRTLVRFSMLAVKYTATVLPNSVQAKIEKQFQKPVIKLAKGEKHELPAFDMVRAAVNLMVASVLISIATSMKLPLSTTYVTFMVAMGSSLADRAWGSESAVYRVAGVLNVIGGWFFTALSAFVAAGTVAYLIHLGGSTMIAVLLLLAVLLLARNYISHAKKSRVVKAEDSLSKAESQSIHGVIEESADNISKALKRVSKINQITINGLIDQDLDALKKAKKTVVKLENEIDELQNDIFYFIKDLDDSYLGASKFYIDVIGSIQDVAQSSSLIAKVSHKHVHNNHKALKKKQGEELLYINDKLVHLCNEIGKIFNARSFDDIEPTIIQEKKELLAYVKDSIQKQVERTRYEESSPKNTTLYFKILLETKDLIKATMNILNLYYEEHNITKTDNEPID
ncbi:inorganic phosphate transporter [Maribacter polysaccharolyticus]|uniref:inorganic phosphate transporter n=1 Tax=Maribacter polysaccharolyticus TaxID=3020831 RepID=UPI00237EFDD4|nr:inorganic phosphate transporter [Maribacter polysaccharolyticus]MDE3742362.1 inorganic phosphate transporter [Maribacter polysaccharolyticus]